VGILKSNRNSQIEKLGKILQEIKENAYSKDLRRIQGSGTDQLTFDHFDKFHNLGLWEYTKVTLIRY
jgi:hypothetical protein